MASLVQGAYKAVKAGQTVTSALSADGHNLIKDAGFNVFLLDADNPGAKAYGDIIKPIENGFFRWMKEALND